MLSSWHTMKIEKNKKETRGRKRLNDKMPDNAPDILKELQKEGWSLPVAISRAGYTYYSVSKWANTNDHLHNVLCMFPRSKRTKREQTNN